jgi:hypothetical protein
VIHFREHGLQHNRQVRSRLVALDHRGYRTVQIEKMEPGPFGFYIATGMLNGKKGIFSNRSFHFLASALMVRKSNDEMELTESECTSCSLVSVINYSELKQNAMLNFAALLIV